MVSAMHAGSSAHTNRLELQLAWLDTHAPDAFTDFETASAELSTGLSNPFARLQCQGDSSIAKQKRQRLSPEQIPTYHFVLFL